MKVRDLTCLFLYQLKKKRKPTEVEFFDMAHQTKNGTYVQGESKEFMVKLKAILNG